MALVLYSVLRRHLKATGRYFEPKGARACPVAASWASDEELLGWYENPAPWDGAAIVFTNKAIYGIDGGDVVRIDLADLVGYETPEKRLDVTGIRVRTRDGFRFLRIAGTHPPQGVATGPRGSHFQRDHRGPGPLAKRGAGFLVTAMADR